MNPWAAALRRGLLILGLAGGFGGIDARCAEPLARGSEGRGGRWIVGISPFLEPAARNEVFRHLTEFVLDRLPTGASAVILDGYRLKTVARIDIPDVRAFAVARTRANQYRSQFQELRRFLITETPAPGVDGLDFTGALRIPALLDFVGDNLVEAGRPTVVILLGSPLHQDEKEPGFSMAQGAFPSDAHLLATRDRSVYGLSDRGRKLEGVVVHLGYFGDPWASEAHRDRVSRFWRLFARGQGARWGTLAGDPPTVFDAADHPLAAVGSGRDEAGGADGQPVPGKLEMLRVLRSVGAADWITSESVAHPARRRPSTTRGPLRIGIRWQGALDLDLYARPRPGGARLYFEQPRSAEGYYYKDHRSSPDREYEFVEFTDPVDVREVEASVNLYEGRAGGGVDGEVRVEFEGRIYVGTFRLESSRGNRGLEGVGQEAAWCSIDLPALLHLR